MHPPIGAHVDRHVISRLIFKIKIHSSEHRKKMSYCRKQRVCAVKATAFDLQKQFS